MRRAASAALVLASALPAGAAFPKPAPFRGIFVVVLENTDYGSAARQPFLSLLAKEGAALSNYKALCHPSQPNYLALVSGAAVRSYGDDPVDLKERHLGDLIEKKGLSWKVYAEGYPGRCFLGATRGRYARKHVPFLSFTDVQKNPRRCARVVPASELDGDIEAGRLPDFSLYIPDLDDDGHDTSVSYADAWLAKAFGPRLKNPKFTRGLLFVVTFDEGSLQGDNRILTVLWGSGVRRGAASAAPYDHFSLLRTFEEGLGLGGLGRGDAKAKAIDDVWRRP